MVIVGGGVNGLSLAYHLAEVHGIRDVAVLERSYLGSGASGRNTQVLRANYNTPETVPLYEASLRMYRTLSQELDFNVLFTDQGELDLCHTPDSLQVEREKSLLNRALGVQTDILTPEEALEVCPLDRPHRRRRAAGRRGVVPPAGRVRAARRGRVGLRRRGAATGGGGPRGRRRHRDRRPRRPMRRRADRRRPGRRPATSSRRSPGTRASSRRWPACASRSRPTRCRRS